MTRITGQLQPLMKEVLDELTQQYWDELLGKGPQVLTPVDPLSLPIKWVVWTDPESVKPVENPEPATDHESADADDGNRVTVIW